MIRGFCAALGVAMMTTPLAAQDRCPTRADLNEGLRLIATRQSVSRLFVARDHGLTVWHLDTPDGPATGPGWQQPHALLPGTRASATGPLTIAYAADIDGLDTLSKGQNWISDVTYLQDGRVAGIGRVEVVAEGQSPLSPHRLGHCTYKVLTYRVAVHIDGATPLFDMLDYAPDLGLVLTETPLDSMGTPHGGIAYDAVAFGFPRGDIEK
ncbi:hypothetical protein ACJ5NV_18120 [Loktanella agnita]|uniref:hypothetical protein n=1 Tax=Loktanella agnita TaxID=287097 RepID=UPI003989996E